MLVLILIVFILSILFPLYTYAFYPLILKLLPKRKSKVLEVDKEPGIDVVIISKNDNKAEKKKEALLKLYPLNKIAICIVPSYRFVMGAVRASSNDFIVITDDDTEYDDNALRNLIKPFDDAKVGCVVGILRKKPNSDGSSNDGVYWKYENRVRELESRIGSVSGANSAIYSLRKKLLPDIDEDIINIEFFISTRVEESGYDVIFEPNAIAYEADKRTKSFEDCVKRASGNYQSISIFKKLRGKTAFVFFSHRVMKWLVPFNMILLFVSNMKLAKNNRTFSFAFILQIAAYIIVAFKHIIHGTRKDKLSSKAGKLLNIVDYFCTLNLSLLIGFMKYIVRNKDKGRNR